MDKFQHDFSDFANLVQFQLPIVSFVLCGDVRYTLLACYPTGRKNTQNLILRMTLVPGCLTFLNQ